MFDKIFTLFSPVLYVQIWESRIKVVNIKTNQIFDDIPLVAIRYNKEGRGTVEAIGSKSKTVILNKRTKLINPFSHPRVLFADFDVAEALLKQILSTLSPDKMFSLAPQIVIHPMDKNEGGYTMIEKRAFKELAFGAGAKEVLVYEGKELSLYDFDFKKLGSEINS